MNGIGRREQRQRHPGGWRVLAGLLTVGAVIAGLATAPGAPAIAAPAAASAPAVAVKEAAESGDPVPSPMVGTAYLQPAPGAEKPSEQ